MSSEGDQKQEIMSCVDPELSIDSYMFIVSKKWYKKWCRSDDSELELDNSDIIKADCRLLLEEKCCDRKYYHWFDERSFRTLDKLCGIAKGQSPIRRKVVSEELDPSNLIIDLFPIILEFECDLIENILPKEIYDGSMKIGVVLEEIIKITGFQNANFWLISNNGEKIDDMNITVKTFTKEKKYAKIKIEPCYDRTEAGNRYLDKRCSQPSRCSELPTQGSWNSFNSPLKSDDLSLKREYKDGFAFSPEPINNMGLVGLRNLGNTCYMNSAIQALIHVKPIKDYFLNCDFRKHLNRENPLGSGGSVAIKFNELIGQFYRKPRFSDIEPSDLKNAISDFSKQFSGYDQHDSQELLVTLIDGLHEDLNKVKKKPYIKTPDFSGMSSVEASELSWRNFTLRNKSVMVDNFYGLIYSKVSCTECDKYAVNYDSFNILSLPLPKLSKIRVTITLTPYDMTGIIKMYRYEISGPTKLSDVIPRFLNDTNIDNISKYYLRENNAKELIRLDDCRDQVNRFMKPNEQLYLYETDPKHEGGFYVLIAHFTEVQISGNLRMNSHPFMVRINLSSNETIIEANMYKEFYNATIKRIENFSKVGSPYTKMIFYQNLNSHVYKRGLFAPLFYQQDLIKNPWSHYSPDESKAYVFHITWDPEVVYQIFEKSYPYSEFDKSEQLLKWINICGKEQLSLENCFKRFFEVETLKDDNAWHCQKCEQDKSANIELSLARMPDNLIVQLKRFHYNRSLRCKIKDFVSFPVKGLDMTKYVTDNETIQYIYDLSAVINHYGSLTGGHYTAYVKCEDNKWYEFNDSRVTQWERSPVTEAAYILLYSRRN